MSGPPVPACGLPSEWSGRRPALVDHRCARRPEHASHAWRGHTARHSLESLLFLFLGALPCIEWLADVVARDRNGFVLTGTNAGAESLLETSIPGVFAAGDVRYGSSKRCDTAVGEGAMAVQLVHARLAAGSPLNGPQPRDRRRTPYRHGSSRGGPRGFRTRRRTYDPRDACLDRSVSQSVATRPAVSQAS